MRVLCHIGCKVTRFFQTCNKIDRFFLTLSDLAMKRDCSKYLVSLYVLVLGLVLMLMVTAAPSLSAQNSKKPVNLQLNVYSDADGEPLVGAACLLTEHGIFSITDPEGTAILEKVPRGKATLTIQMLGFEDYVAKMNFGRDSILTIRLKESSLALEQVVVTAVPSAAGASTSSTVGRMAIDHLQATSLKDIMQLIPGQLMTSSDMTSEEKMTIRSVGLSTDNNAFGTSVVMDGVPMSDNASIGDKASGSSGGTGLDLRQISADNIESVEVIRGIPSAEYGDLTSGAVVVNTKAGYTPYEVRAKYNPTTLNVSLGKGWKFDKKGGSFNVNADYARASSDPRMKNRSFDRINGGFTYSNGAGKWSSTTKAHFSGIIDLRTDDPDVLVEGTQTSQKQFTARITHNGRFSFNTPWSRSVNYALGLTINNNETRKSAIVSASGGLPVITSLTDGYSTVPWLTDSYRASGGTISRPVNFYAKIGNVASVTTGPVQQRFNMGAEYRLESNKARGFYNDDETMPLTPNSNGRPRPYYDIPALHQLSAYLEDNLTWDITKTIQLKVQVGGRFDMLQPGLPEQVWSLSPRINASLKVTDWLSFRGGWGQSNKTPGLSHLYPEAKYMDREVASYLPADPANQLVMYNTHITEVVRNNTLKNATNTKAEAGFDLHFQNGMSFSVVAYQEKMVNGFGNLTEYSTFLSRYYSSEKGIVLTPAGKPYIDWDNPARVDTVFVTSGRIGNTSASLDRGVEFDFNFGQIKPIRTSVLLSGAYMETQNWTTGPNFSSPSGIPADSDYAKGGANTPPFKLLYPSGLSKDISRRFSMNLRLVCNIPRMKMVISLANQVIFYQYSHSTNQKSDPIAWMDTDLRMYEITPAMLADPDYRIKGVLLSDQRRNPGDTEPTIQPPIWLMNLRLTKDVSKNFGFSFFVNNAFFYMPYQSTNKSATLTERNTGTFSFGVEMYLKI